ncbi:MAG TPA: bis(5'-nucleosyl)-tetraphosphatase [Candidatus Pacearchaeota archaeon]|nr:bis(5'-nucleosyl)-tetraphosphatase [Candidatus Pacearchaeota archaeon]HOK93928.1 bis(5'-nucleosyl)-tetraphosphatase [Candidatus Pacearchaeota archaeon]HPO74999.1 bis(5'-nucleosyl)-tetraphosphatase [Candidatus Pacearchaeota archaeon]
MARREKTKQFAREKSAGAIIFRKEPFDTTQGKKVKIYYLLLHYPSGHWDFAKGHIEKGESEKEAAKREIEEETGIKDVNFISGFREKITYFFRKSYENQKNPPLIFKEVVFYLGETREKEVKISEEHIGYQWLPYEKAIKKVTFKNAKEILKKANEFLKNSQLLQKC